MQAEEKLFSIARAMGMTVVIVSLIVQCISIWYSIKYGTGGRLMNNEDLLWVLGTIVAAGFGVPGTIVSLFLLVGAVKRQREAHDAAPELALYITGALMPVVAALLAWMFITQYNNSRNTPARTTVVPAAQQVTDRKAT